MAWRVPPTVRFNEYLSFFGRLLLTINVFMFGIASLYITGQFLIHFVDYLDRTVFRGPW